MAEEFAKTLERYDVVDRIAVGGMAEVFLAKAYGAHGFEKTLAIKRILPDLARDPEFEQRFIAEAKVAVRLSHTNIVQVMDFGRFAESLFIAMEYVDGLDLAALLRRYKELGVRVPIPAAFQIAIEIARGLDYAHQHGVVHRDVSPSNILLSRAGEVKIADFGIAIAARPQRGAAAGTGPRKVMGKWRYMSPEQARGEPLDTRSDLFSAAAVMYELFTGEKLFPGDEAEDIIKNIHEMTLPRASRVREGLPARLDEILHAALARRPLDRPARAAVMLRALTELSYESSIVCTTIDVSDAVSYVLPTDKTGANVVDEMIRRQLAGEADVARETAVTDGKKRQTLVTGHEPAGVDTTGVFRHKIDLDGLSRLEIAEPPDSTTLAAQPRARRQTSQPDGDQPVGPTLTGLAAATSAPPPRGPLDPDRRTEVGPPLAESRPFFKVDADEQDRTAAREKIDAEVVDAPPPRRGRAPTPMSEVTPTGAGPAPGPSRRAWFALSAVAIAGVVVAVYALTRRPEAAAPPVVADAIDAQIAPPPTPGHLAITSKPAGGAVRVDGEPRGTAPVTVDVPAGDHEVIVELAGHDRFEARIAVASGATVPVTAALVAKKARLQVTTTPDGATVKLAGVDLGHTPLDRDGLEPRRGAALEVTRQGFEPVRARVDLIAGEVAAVTYALVESVHTGRVRITLKAGWAQVFYKKKHLGDTPGVFTIPVGSQELLLVNPETKKKLVLPVSVDENQLHDYLNRELK